MPEIPRGAKMESHGILIEWDHPKPVRPVVWKPNMDSWAKRLAPMKQTPNRRARILRDLKPTQYPNRLASLRASLRKRDPRSKWKIEQAKQDDGLYSVYVTYQGVMSDAEYEEAVALHQWRSRETKRKLAEKERKKELKRSPLNPTLKPPTIADLEEKAREIAKSRS